MKMAVVFLGEWYPTLGGVCGGGGGASVSGEKATGGFPHAAAGKAVTELGSIAGLVTTGVSNKKTLRASGSQI